MKALTLWQPWAAYIACGSKKCETRSWYTPYRGPLAIHAARRPLTEGERELLEEIPIVGPAARLAFGAVVATARLVDVRRISGPHPDEIEDALGDWSPGRFAWVLLDVQPLDPPIPARGGQGLWEWSGRPA